MSIDASEVTAFGRDLVVKSALTFTAATAVVEKAALNIKNDARQRATGIPHAGGYPFSIKYERVGLRAEIGPEIGGRQWGLGDILEYGVPSRNTAPRPHLGPALAAEAPKFEQFLAEAAIKALD